MDVSHFELDFSRVELGLATLSWQERQKGEIVYTYSQTASNYWRKVQIQLFAGEEMTSERDTFGPESASICGRPTIGKEFTIPISTHIIRISGPNMKLSADGPKYTLASDISHG